MGVYLEENIQYLRKIQNFTASFLEYENLQPIEYQKQWNEIADYEMECRKAGVFLPVVFLQDIFLMTPYEKLMIYFALAYDLSPIDQMLWKKAEGLLSRPTIGQVIQFGKILNLESVETVYDFFKGEYPLSRLLFEDTFLVSELPLLSVPLVLNQRVFSFILTGDMEPPETIGSFCSLFVPEDSLSSLFLNEETEDRAFQLMEAFQKGTLENICFYGPQGVGKKFLLKHCLRRIGRMGLFIDADRLLEKRNTLTEIVRELLLTGAVACIYHIQDTKECCKKLNEVLNEFEKFGIQKFAFLCDGKEAPDLNRPIAAVEVELPDAQTSEKLWEYLNRSYGVSTDFTYLAANIALKPRQITAALAQAKAEGGNPSPEEMMRIASNQLKHELGKKANKVKLSYAWEDLIVEKSVEEKLKDACKHVKFKHKVYEQWGFRDKMAYGKGLCLLFYGPSGTGKTMAAQVIAKELGLSLYRIDLSQIISKYIGETQQNLNQIFEEAGKTNAILFFDEADALFSKRTEIKDATDKYSNGETAFLLQKTEDYSGVSILASNLMYNLDEAFRRRIHYTIYFPLPDAKLRLKIWKNLLGKDVPLGKDVDFYFLAEKFELSPAQIKQVVLNAAFLSAAEEDAITMRYILKALKNEYDKSGKILLKEELEDYKEAW